MRSASLVRTGLTNEVVAHLVDYEASDLPESWKAALALCDWLSGFEHSGVIPPEMYERLSEHFNEQQILRLGALLASASGWHRMIEAFGIRPDHYSEGQSSPWAAAAG
ncbi:carboxymuconolactone decarboxylase family protein [Candidatus Poriferisodalis sp.]|uniref:carboxymuconolactone decarboxylase family protein n=1 Tax=Candidatus Poriferisodalis sp. TaxID=3101277 RepID=UPI003D0FA1A1